MIIRSQDKRKITDDLKLNISVCDFANCNITYRIYTSTREWLGTYSTEEKAIKVLDMICEQYVRNQALYIDRENNARVISQNSVFRMPSDEEVEV